MKKSLKRLVLAVTALFCCVLAAGEPWATEPEHQWTVEDVLLAESAAQFRISPDGRWAVWVKTQMDKEKGERVSNLFLSNLTDNRTIPLTRGTETHTRPRWSPDGRLIGFLSTRPLRAAQKELAKTQLWLINPFGGEPWPLTEFERDIRAYAWKDKDTIVFAAQEDPTQFEHAIKEKKDTSQVVEDAPHEPPVRLFLLDVKGKKVRRLTGNDDWIDLLEVSPDGRWAVTRHQRSLRYEYDNRVPPATYLANLETGEQIPLLTDAQIFPSYAAESPVAWARDSRGFYLVSEFTRHPRYRQATISLLYYCEVPLGDTTPVELDWANGLGAGQYQVTGDGVIALLADGVRFRPARFTRTGGRWERRWLEGEHADRIFGWALGEDGRTLLYDHSTASQPGQWYHATLEGTKIENSAPLTELNPGYQGKPLPRTEIVRWPGARQEEVEGILHYPLNYSEGKRYPLILAIHGGPAAADMDAWEPTWSYPLILFVQRGAFVLQVNYHGSSNYGLEWVESIGEGNYYDLEIPDIEAGVDYLIGRGLAHPDKLATMGWSNGSILSIELVTRNLRYKAISAGAGNVEFFGDWGLVEFGAAWDHYYLGKAPYEDPELYLRKSPFFRLQNVVAPTIIYFGTEDRAVGTVNGWNHFRALQLQGKPVRFLLFPGEGHSLRRLVHQRRKVEEELAWFDQHLFGGYQAPNEAFKEGSPLDVALKRTQIKKQGTRYGVLSRDTLIPEVVHYRGVELGRFEVTRSQFAAFDRTYAVEPGSENFPANGISFQQAQAYCAWLAKLTGEPYRLGTEEELNSLYEAAGGNENTLDHWAGYALNPDDAERLAAKVAALPGVAPLLTEVGRFAGRGEDDLVFDLGGNVAEWVIGADGTGVVRGGSADQPADFKAKPRPPAEAYRGLRVVRGQPKTKEKPTAEPASR